MALLTFDSNLELRPCFVKINGSEVRALFHCWEHYECVDQPLSITTPYMKQDITSFTDAIVEFDNGEILRMSPDKIRFTDSAGRFNEYSWDEKKEE